MISSTIINKFIDVVKDNMDNVALVVDDKEYTYKDLDEMSNAFAQSIAEMYSEIQIPILVFGDHPLQISCSIIGVMKTRNIVVPVSNNIPYQRIKGIVDTCNVRGYLSLKEHPELSLPHIPIKYDHMNDFFYNGSVDDDAYIIYTSGTTGKSKGPCRGRW